MVIFSLLEHIFTAIKTKFKILISCIFTGPYGGMWNLWTPCTGGSSELISKISSSMILNNHSSYLESGEINSCRLSSLPTHSNQHSVFFLTIVSNVHLILRIVVSLDYIIHTKCNIQHPINFPITKMNYASINCRCRGAGKARFNVATPTNATVTCTAYVLPYNFQTKSI